jgi:effector-binding domain-containing protein
MKALKIVGIILLVVVLALVAIGLVTPKSYDIKRDIVINASNDVVFNNVSHYAEFPKWSPWQELDPNMKTNLEGTDGTVGAKYSWEGNDKVGSGSMTIAKLEPGKTVEHNLEFLKPFKSSSYTYVTIEPADGGQKVTWGMKGESGFVSRIFMTLMGGMDKMVGSDYEKGLKKLKALSEAGGSTAATYTVTETEWAAKTCLSIRKEVAFADIPNFFETHLPKMAEAIGKAGARQGIPLGVYYVYDEANKKTDMAVAIPYEGAKVVSKEYKGLSLPAQKAYVIDYYGEYGDKMMPAYDAMNAKLKELGRDNPDLVIEEYVGDPMVEKDPSKVLTKIYFFVNEKPAAK